MPRVTVVMDKDTLAAVKRAAKRNDRSVSYIIVQAVKAIMANPEHFGKDTVTHGR